MSRAALVFGSLVAATSSLSPAADLYRHDNWAAMASDRRAGQVGDLIDVLVFENATATNTVQKASTKGTHLKGELNVGKIKETPGIGFDGSYNGTGQTARSGRIVAEISVKVDEVLPNGDLVISGEQRLNINGEKTFIKLRGRVRPEDIRDNSIASSRIGEAEIDYDGSGFVSRSARPGLITRIFNFLGLV